MFKTASMVIVVLAAAGCSTSRQYSSVIPISGGNYVAVAAARTEGEALEQSLAKASEACSAKSMRPAVKNQQMEYRGTVSESTNRGVDKVGGVVKFATLGIIRPTLTNDDDYKSTLEFTCES